ncbi:MAG: hypothetical protein D6798_11155 [Deltaproteobacteria bacterium]|nr:MAG: hypothetical protein D6798_11155 [Deltaproteobacteria bacterium]
MLPSRAPLLFSVALALAPACTGGGDGSTDSGEGLPEPGDFVAGLARAPIPAPLGIGTAGFGPFDAPDSVSPFADIYPATTRIHGFPEIKALALSRGEGYELVFVRLDAVGVFQQLRRAVVLELEERTGQDFDDILVIGATHTHSAPGRVIDGGGLFDLIADSFFPEYYDRLVDALADTVEAAIADRRAARLGTTIATCQGAHADRRCEDGLDYTNDDLPLVVVERDGQVDAVLMSYAVHGTVLGIDDLTLSQDVSGAIEQAVEDGFDHPVEALMLNAWAADMSPGDPEVPTQEGVADRPEGYDRMERVGTAMQQAVLEALDDLSWTDTPDLSARTVRVPIDREVIGYEGDVFPYEYGAVYCDGDADCDPSTTVDGLDHACLPFSEQYPAPRQTLFTAGRVGPLTLLTFPGEPGTLLAEQIMEQARAAWPESVGDILFVGYAQDYLGYSILEEDWWQGGYEASGALWGPRQGEYLAARAVEAVGAFLGEVELGDEPDPITPFTVPDYEPYEPEEAIGGGVVEAGPTAPLGPTDTVEVTVTGGDPWLGPPQATLATADGTPVTRPGGIPLSSDDYEFQVDLAVDPSYADSPGPTARTFRWTFRLPVQRTTAGWASLDSGSYVMYFTVPLSADQVVEVATEPFTVQNP